MPIPHPPRTPTPPPEEAPSQTAGLGLDGMADLLSPSHIAFDPHALSPMRENFQVHSFNTPFSPSLSTIPLSPSSPNTAYSSTNGSSKSSNTGSLLQDDQGPFNFQPMPLAKSPVTKSVGRATDIEDLTIADYSTERGATTWTQIQTQQRLAPDIPRT